MKLVNTSLHTQLIQTNLENRLHISIKSPKECFNDMVFHHFMDELKQCNSDMQMDLKLPVPVFLDLYIKCLVMLPFRMISFHNVFCFIYFPHEFVMF